MTTTLTAPESNADHRRPAARCTARTRRAHLRHAFVLAKRNLIKTWRTPEQLIDVTLQPIIFLLLFVYVFGGAIGGGSRHDYLQFLLPGLLGQGIAMGSIALGQNLNADIEKGVFDRFRSLPIARSAPLVGAVLRRLLPLPDPVRDLPRVRLRASASASTTGPLAGARRRRAVDRLRAVLLLDLGVGRA